MDTNYYLDLFRNTAARLDKKLLHKKQVEVAAVIYKDCVVLKLFKKAWAGDPQEPLSSPSRIFFSIWLTDTALKEKKILYNIHALKMRHLKGYTIASRKFAEVFRSAFRDFEPEWPNVSVKFGPLTLMEGWKEIDLDCLQDEMITLVNAFLSIEHLIDDTLHQFKDNR